jgi:hypothetical protein
MQRVESVETQGVGLAISAGWSISSVFWKEVVGSTAGRKLTLQFSPNGQP